MKTGVLLINLGTPDSPSVKDVRKYLRQFFSDPRVIDIPWIQRELLKYLIILPFRSPKSAALYKEIWTPGGSPLMVHGLALKKKLEARLGEGYIVELGMGYGNPSIASALKRLCSLQLHKLAVIPLFPQYASSTTGSVLSCVMDELKKKEIIPPLETVSSFFREPLFIAAWAESIRRVLPDEDAHLLFSYHGLPERHIRKTDYSGHCLKEGCCHGMTEKNHSCYRAQCFETTRLIAGELKITPENYSISFQSRLGKSPWIRPYTDETLITLAEKGEKRVVVAAPSFVADCLETLQEIGIEYAELFGRHGGKELILAESLNSSEPWVECLHQIIGRMTRQQRDAKEGTVSPQTV